MAGERLRIVQVSPHPWGSEHELNRKVSRSAELLAARGHDVVVTAPSESRSAVRASRRAVEELSRGDTTLVGWEGERAGPDGPPVLTLGSGIPLPRGPKPRAAPVPLDVTKPLEELLGRFEPDIVHVHDPFAPSVSSAALRNSWSLNVGSFHEPSERILSTQLARPLVEIFFGRLDARTVDSAQTGELMRRFFPGPYELLEAPADPAEPIAWPGEATDGGPDRPLRIAFCLGEERGALRLALRALRRLPGDANWEAAIWQPTRRELRISKRLAGRVRECADNDHATAEGLIAAADVVICASGGPKPAPWIIRQALASGTIPVVSAIPLYTELTANGDRGLLFPPGDPLTLRGQLERLIGDGALRETLRSRGPGSGGGEAFTDRLEEIYARLVARRHPTEGDRAAARRLRGRELIHVDLHMHTDHSPDCATPIDVLLETAKDRDLGAIAITDHNEVSGALAARERAREIGGIEVIVAEEIKTAEQGEVIGLFLEEKIERGMTMAETIAAIRDQGGLVYVPHPFDRLHSVPDYEHLLDMVEDIDILEVFNPRVALTAFNEEAERFAAKYRIVPGAGSDSHVAQGLGSVMIRLPRFEGPQEFLEAMREADIVRKHRNLIYVQALKFVQTNTRPKSPKPPAADRRARPVRGGKPTRTRR
ncbi:glycosyltransferase [Thermoleophilia bacterium SCSIO 60948]|nr:glycosyltransferase [Thermoleophilia bacterium SCSIO 60948]